MLCCNLVKCREPPPLEGRSSRDRGPREARAESKASNPHSLEPNHPQPCNRLCVVLHHWRKAKRCSAVRLGGQTQGASPVGTVRLPNPVGGNMHVRSCVNADACVLEPKDRGARNAAQCLHALYTPRDQCGDCRNWAEAKQARRDPRWLEFKTRWLPHPPCESPDCQP